MPCLTDHLTLATKFCPACGWHQFVPREPGEFAAMSIALEALLQKQPSQTGLLIFVVALSTIEWARGNMPTEIYLAACGTSLASVARES